MVFQQLTVIFPGGKRFRRHLGPLCILRALQREDQARTELSPWLLCAKRTFPVWRGPNPSADALRGLVIVQSGSRMRGRSHAEMAQTLLTSPPWLTAFPC